MRVLLTPGRWADRYAPVRRLGFGGLLVAYGRYYAVPLYLALMATAGAGAVLLAPPVGAALATVAFVLLGFPVAEWTIHRFILHCPGLYRIRVAAAFWKRVHYDHHMEPRRLDVLFAAPWVAVSAVALLTVPPPLLLAGPGAAAAGFAAGMAMFLVYEFFHCAAHLPFATRSRMFRRLRRHHLLHHYHSERGNYGIASDWIDRLTGLRYRRSGERPASPTVRNLGYTVEEAGRYPKVASLATPEMDEILVHAR